MKFKIEFDYLKPRDHIGAAGYFSVPDLCEQGLDETGGDELFPIADHGHLETIHAEYGDLVEQLVEVRLVVECLVEHVHQSHAHFDKFT